MPIKVLGASSYKLGFWILQCIFFCVLGHVGLNFLIQNDFLKLPLFVVLTCYM